MARLQVVKTPCDIASILSAKLGLFLPSIHREVPRNALRDSSHEYETIRAEAHSLSNVSATKPDSKTG